MSQAQSNTNTGQLPLMGMETKSATKEREFKNPYESPKAWKSLINDLYSKTTSKKKFSLVRLCRSHGFKDTRMIEFLQDLNAVRNDGSAGVHAVWRWNTTFTPLAINGVLVMNSWRLWKDDKFGVTRAFPIKSKSTTGLKDIEVVDEVVIGTERQTHIKEKPTSPTDRKLGWIEEKIIHTHKSLSVISESLVTIAKDTSATKMVAQNTANGFRNETITVETPVFFGLFKLKSTIKLNK